MADASTVDAAVVAGNRSVSRRVRGFLFSRAGAWLGFAVALAAVYVGWIGREQRDINAGEGIGYALGIAGTTAMLMLLVYSFRKRLPMARFLGKTRYWFRAHMTLGIVGPILVLYHCNFEVKALNSRVALYCTLLVACSGLVGRYLYAHIHHGLYGRKASLLELGRRLDDASGRLESRDGLMDGVREQLAELVALATVRPASLRQSLSQSVLLSVRTRVAFFRLNRSVRRRLSTLAATSDAVRQHRPRLERSSRVFLGDILRQVRRVAHFNTYERLFSWWHVIHVPFFMMMVFSAVVHVLAVHMY